MRMFFFRKASSSLLARNNTHQTAVTQYVVVNGNRLAYKKLGQSTGVTVVMLMCFRGNMDW